MLRKFAEKPFAILRSNTNRITVIQGIKRLQLLLLSCNQSAVYFLSEIIQQ